MAGDLQRINQVTYDEKNFDDFISNSHARGLRQ